MAEMEQVEAAEADDTLFILTAALLTPAQFPAVLGDDYPEACAALGLGPHPVGYGLVFGQDGDGARWTVVVDDVSLVAVAIATWDCGMEYDLSPDEHTVVAALPGWPLELTVTAPGVPEPHDPPAGPDDPAPLAPPDTGAWGPAQRRLGADAVALQWAVWREQFDADDAGGDGETPRETARETAGTPVPGTAVAEETAAARETAGVPVRETTAPSRERAGAPVRETTPAQEVPAARETAAPARETAGATSAHPPVPPSGSEAPDGHARLRRVLDDLRGYLVEPPPPGRVRSAFAPGGARTLRADGPGWSLVARTDDIAFVLLDDMPGEVLPVGRGPNLPGLLAALDQMAVRPA
ncbi:hypothetical protein [Streptomyces lichenis]|uniref:Integral membrane protein n=1 Tax=Streptomyces lichenis TaxID=2306967 RepID=A0ABT0I8Q2_9ACTN|nr:hypothetical protein [Streptomyces lichenis]MCK8677706.1 hypothetical protein [Streptomyces lichenis]